MITFNPHDMKRRLSSNGVEYEFFSLSAVEEAGYDIRRFPFCIRILLENALRNFDGFAVTEEHLGAILNWKPISSAIDIPFKPARVLMQDFTGVPAIVDIASLRAEIARRGMDPKLINPLVPVDLVIDHSVQVDNFASSYAYEKNIEQEYERNSERYEFLKWAQNSLDNFKVVPPGMGICHQVNLEYLATCVVAREGFVFPDTLVGTDSHTPMVNGIGVLGWGVGGIEAEASLLGQPLYFLLPEVIGLNLTGIMPPGVTGTDLVLTITELMRVRGVIGKFVEVFGDGLDNLSVPERASIGNMSPEFGCTVTYFPVDDKTLEYMEGSNRSPDQKKLVTDYCKANLLWRNGDEEIIYSETIFLDLNTIEPTVAGPKRPQDKISLRSFKSKFVELLDQGYGRKYIERLQLEDWKTEGGSQSIATVPAESPYISIESLAGASKKEIWVGSAQQKFSLNDGVVVIAAITSCTNTSNPLVMIGAGLVARKARELGLTSKSWVKTSLAPGSKVVTEYLNKANVLNDLEALGFHVVGYGCTSCIGNSGPLPIHIAQAIEDNDLVVASVLSGNRNFEARIHPQVRMNFLMSPMLVVAYAIAGRVDVDLVNDPIDFDHNQQPIYLKDIWPSDQEVRELTRKVLSKSDFEICYSDIFEGNAIWRELKAGNNMIYNWNEKSSYIKEAPFFKDLPVLPATTQDITGACVLLMLGDSVTTDHISPAGSFNEISPAGQYLLSKGIDRQNFNSYGSRRGNDEVMIRGTFANIRIRNKLASMEGGITKHLPTDIEMPVYDAAMRYRETATPLIVLAGKDYGSGSSRDWAAKGTFLLGVKAVLAQSFERIHRSNLVGMGVLPLEYLPGDSAESLSLNGLESISIKGLHARIYPGKLLKVVATGPDGIEKSFQVKARLDSLIEIAYYTHGGILQYVLRQFMSSVTS